MTKSGTGHSGYRGVQWNAKLNKFQAQVRGKYLGSFESAVAAAIEVNDYIEREGITGLKPNVISDEERAAAIEEEKTAAEDTRHAYEVASQAGFDADRIKSFDFEGSFLNPDVVAANRAAYDEYVRNGRKGPLNLPYPPDQLVNAVKLKDGSYHQIPLVKKPRS